LSNAKASLSRSLPLLLREMEVKSRKLAGEDRLNFTGISSESSPSGGSGRRDDEPNVTPLASFLRTAGDTMIGALAFYPTAVTISSGAIDITQDTTGKFSTYVIVSGEGAADDTLATITGAGFAGQIIYLQPILTNQITLTETGGNLILPGGTNVVVNSAKDGRQVVKLIFDVTVNANKWTLVSNSAGGGGVSFPITPTINDHGNVGTVTEDIDLSASDGHVHKITLTGNPTLTFSNPPASGTQIEFEIEYVQDATAGRTVTQPGSVAETVSISSGASSTTIVTYRTNDGGTIYHAIPALRGSITLSAPFLPLAGGTMSGNIDMGNQNISNMNLVTTSNATVTATFNANGTVNLGDAVTDQINFLGRINTDLVPITISTHNLGISGLQWDALWVNRIESATTVTGSPFNINSAVITLGDAITDSIAFLGRLSSDAVIPLAGNVTDLGASTLEFADAYINRIASTITFTGATTNINSTTINLGDAITDTINFLGRLGSNAVIPIADNVTDLGTTILEFRDLFIDGTANIDTLAATTMAGNLTMGNNNIILGTGQLQFNDSTETISVQNGDMIFDVPATDFFSWDIAGVSEMTLDATELDLQANNIVDCGNIIPSAAGVDDLGSSTVRWNDIFAESISRDADNGILLNTTGIIVIADQLDINIGGGGAEAVFNATEMQFNTGYNIVMTSSSLNGYVELNELTGDPAAPPTNRARFYCKDNGGKTELLVRFATGAVQSLAIEP